MGDQIESLSGETEQEITKAADDEPRKPERSPLTKHLCSIQLQAYASILLQESELREQADPRLSEV